MWRQNHGSAIQTDPCHPSDSTRLKCARTCSVEPQPVPITSAARHPVSPPSLHYYTANRLRKVEKRRRRRMRGLSGVKIERERKCDRERWWPKKIKEAAKEGEAAETGERAESESKEMKTTGEREGEEREKKREERELCSCGSVLNNHFCVSSSTHQQRTSCIAEALSRRKNNYHWRQIQALLSHGSVPDSAKRLVDSTRPPLLAEHPDRMTEVINRKYMKHVRQVQTPLINIKSKRTDPHAVWKE